MPQKEPKNEDRVLFSLPETVQIFEELKVMGDLRTMKTVGVLVGALLQQTRKEVSQKRGEEILICIGKIQGLEALEEFFNTAER